MAATAAGVALTAALIASVGAVLAGASATMTAPSIQRVPVDWQVDVSGDPNAVTRVVRDDPRVMTSRPVGFATLAGLRAGSASVAGGQAVGLPDDYGTAFPGQVRILAGEPGVLLTQR